MSDSTIMRWSFDRDLWRWSARSVREPGPAGVASAWLSETLRVDVDAWDGTVLSMVVDVDDAAGALRPDDEDVLARVLHASVSDGAPVVVASSRADALSRLARVTEGQRVEQAFGPTTSAWSNEIAELRASLDLRADLTAPPGSTDHSADSPVATDADALERLVERPHDLGSLVDPSGRLLVDPSFVPAAILDLSAGGGVHWDDGGSWLRIELPLQEGIYAAEVMGLVVVVLDRGTVVALGVPEPTLSADGVVASARLPLAPVRRHADLLVVVTDRATQLPSQNLLASRSATHLARVAATAHRLGDPRLSDELLERSLARWRVAGRDVGAVAALPSEAPFLGELAR